MRPSSFKALADQSVRAAEKYFLGPARYFFITFHSKYRHSTPLQYLCTGLFCTALGYVFANLYTLENHNKNWSKTYI